MQLNSLRAQLRRAFDGDLALFGGPPISAAIAGQVRAAQISVVHSYTPWMMGACIVNALALVCVTAPTSQFSVALIWAGIVCPAAAAVFLRWWRGRGQAAPTSVSPRAMQRATVNAIVYGAIWSLVPVLFFTGDGRATDLFVICICAGMMCGGSIALSTIPAAAALATMGVCLGTAFALLRSGDALNALIGVLLASYTIALIKTCASHANTFVARILAHIEGERQREVIGMLLCDFEENASDWLWEIDAGQRLVHVSARLAALLNCLPEDLAGRGFSSLFVDKNDPANAAAKKECADLFARIAQGVAFRDMIVPLNIHGARRIWSLTGKPVLSRGGKVEGFRGVGADVTDAREAEERIRYLARNDSLTGLPNRASFHDQLEIAVTRLSRHGEPFAVHCLDLDHLKETNDTFGHAAGDAMLAAVATRLSALMSEADFLARVGGDEFAIIQSRVTTPETASQLAADVARALAAPLFVNGASVRLGASIGIAMAPSDGRDADSLLKNADLALHRSKQSGRGSCNFYEAEMDLRARARRQIEADLRMALAGNEFILHYQPLIDIATGRIAGCEALLRWSHPTRGLVMPSDFIAIAEDTGLIVAMGEWVLAQACMDAAQWPDNVRVAVNLSAVQFRSPGLAVVVSKALRDSGLAANRLEVEVTESVLISEHETVGAILGALRLMGVRIALDDFGTGYSSLSYLRQMPFDKIKIDRSFINDLLTQPDSAAIVNALIGLAGSLRMSVTAEGVETAEQLAHLRDKGCGEAQGYLFGKPTPAREFTALLARGAGDAGLARHQAAA